MLAKELATLDIISGGRLIVVAGVGGDFPKEFEAAGVPMARRGRRTSETIEIMRKLLDRGALLLRRQIFQLDDVWMTPKPVQPGGPPIWLAGRSSAAIERAARLGDGYMPYMYTPSAAATAFEEVRAKADAARGRACGRGFVVVGFRLCEHDDDPADRRASSAIRDLSWRYGKDFTPWIDKYCVHGHAGPCVAQLREFVDAGVEHLALGMIHEESIALDTAPSLEASRRQRSTTIERFGRELLPALTEPRSKP